MARLGSQLSLGRVAAIVTVLGLTALPFVSCSAGPVKINFSGHEILRNVPPSVDGKKVKDKDSLFAGKDAWMHWTYVAATIAAILGLAVVRRTAIASAVAGFILTVVFLVGFNSRIKSEVSGKSSKKAPKDDVGMTMEIGAYLALLGFAASAASGFSEVRRRQQPTPPQSTTA